MEITMTEADVTVIGGGAAGLVAAVAAARCGARTRILEHMDRVGKKILSTGNGKCNYTNALQGVSYYRGEDPAFVLPVFAQFGHEETVRFFRELGIMPKERRGYFYPASEQAASVLEVLRMECAYLGVETVTSCAPESIRKSETGYRIQTNCGTYQTRKLIFATGLLAAPKTGSDGSAFSHIKKLGHHFIDIVPALVPLVAKQSCFKALAGIRTEACVTLYIDGRAAVSETGEVQLTDYGISGIPVFQISRFATRALQEKRAVSAKIHFLPSLAREDVKKLLAERFYNYAHDKDCSQALIGLCNKKLGDVLLKESGISLHLPAKQMSGRQLERLCEALCSFQVDIIGSKPVEAAQVCAGGIPVCEVEQETLQSKLAPGVYFAGEVLDVDGTCGGYNLQWAWSSGYVSGVHAAEAACGRKESEKR